MKNDAYTYSNTAVIVFGILGNSLVITWILKQKRNLLKNNYYFLVLHLAICDLAVLIIYYYETVELHWLKEPLSSHSPMIICYGIVIAVVCQLAGIGMMLTISLLRYRATVHPLKPAVSRRKLKVVCGLVYLVGLIAGGGARFPRCFRKSNVMYVAYLKFYYAYIIFFVNFVPTIFMAVVYYKIGRALREQRKYMKTVMHERNFTILKYIRNPRTFLVCLSIVLCYGMAHIPVSVWLMWYIVGENYLQMRYVWVRYFAYVLRIVGSHAINPLIYGILDKKLLKFWKCCRKEKQLTQEN